MKWLFRPAVWIGLSVALVAAAALVSRPKSGPPQAVPVRPGETEIVFLYPATSTTTWERFVAALRRAQDRLQQELPGLEIDAGDWAFPTDTAAVPEVVVRYPGGARLVFRWYKVSGDSSAGFWVRSLLERSPPPLAVIGGGTSYWARELAIQLRTTTEQSKGRLPEEARPILVFTTATADKVALPEAPGEGEDPFAHLRPRQQDDEPSNSPSFRPLHLFYPGRSFRFAFTNRQMASAVTRFLWSRDELRPDRDPWYVAQWLDDVYSRDLLEGYRRALARRVFDGWAEQWGWVGGWGAQVGAPGGPFALLGGAFPLSVAGRNATAFRLEDVPPFWIDSSVGTFATPNTFEAEQVELILEQVRSQRPPQRRPLLVVSGQAQPSRRLLRQLARSSEPETAHRFVVAAGDSISFNTVYRDRKATWPIQDLPFTLVFFCHQNPIDPGAGFAELPPWRTADAGDPPAEGSTGTEDVLLFAEIVEALIAAFPREGRPSANAAEFASRLREARVRQVPVTAGTRLFNAEGQRVSGTGEHVVYLRPVFAGKRVLPRAVIEVWAWRQVAGHERNWQRCGKPLEVSYEEAPEAGRRAHGE